MRQLAHRRLHDTETIVRRSNRVSVKARVRVRTSQSAVAPHFESSYPRSRPDGAQQHAPLSLHPRVMRARIRVLRNMVEMRVRLRGRAGIVALCTPVKIKVRAKYGI